LKAGKKIEKNEDSEENYPRDQETEDGDKEIEQCMCKSLNFGFSFPYYELNK